MAKKLIYVLSFILILGLEFEYCYQAKAGSSFAAIVWFITICVWGCHGWDFLFGHDEK